MKIIEDLFKIPRYLLGEGYDQALEYINNILPLEVHEFKSGTEVFDWKVPEEWVIRDAWVKFNGEKILDFKENPMCLSDYSIPIHEKMGLEEFKKHLHFNDEIDAYSYSYKFYEKDWGFTMPRSKVELEVQGEEGKVTKSSVLTEGEYEVFIDSEFKPGTMKIGVHTIPGKTEREILLFAHLDHPHQANDNLSAIYALIDMAGRLKGFEHTIKLIFCPETIGSITYVEKQDVSKVDFVIALDCVGNDNSVLFQKTYSGKERINDCALLALQSLGADYRAGQFRLILGSDEYVFNDPQIGIPAIMFSRFPYKEYHTSEDTPTIIKQEKIKQMQEVVLKTIEIYEKDFIPVRKKLAPLFRAKYNLQTNYKLMNRNLDYLWYDIDNKKYLTEIISRMGMSFEYALEIMDKLLTTGSVEKGRVLGGNDGKVL